MNLRELPVLDEFRCTGCGDCVEVCPTDCLDMNSEGFRLPVLAWPHKCVSCGLCAAICPEDAIALQARWCA
jgi:NAD-dependent dihydropyrimidine dehydrogenase PreA subunit